MAVPVFFHTFRSPLPTGICQGWHSPNSGTRVSIRAGPLTAAGKRSLFASALSPHPPRPAGLGESQEAKKPSGRSVAQQAHQMLHYHPKPWLLVHTGAVRGDPWVKNRKTVKHSYNHFQNRVKSCQKGTGPPAIRPVSLVGRADDTLAAGVLLIGVRGRVDELDAPEADLPEEKLERLR